MDLSRIFSGDLWWFQITKEFDLTQVVIMKFIVFNCILTELVQNDSLLCVKKWSKILKFQICDTSHSVTLIRGQLKD